MKTLINQEEKDMIHDNKCKLIENNYTIIMWGERLINE